MLVCTSASADIFQINNGLRRCKELWVICSSEGYTSCILRIPLKEGRISRLHSECPTYFSEMTASMTYAAFECDLRRAQPSKWDTAYSLCFGAVKIAVSPVMLYTKQHCFIRHTGMMKWKWDQSDQSLQISITQRRGLEKWIVERIFWSLWANKVKINAYYKTMKVFFDHACMSTCCWGLPNQNMNLSLPIIGAL